MRDAKVSDVPAAAGVTAAGDGGASSNDRVSPTSARAARTRRAVVDALLSLIEGGSLRPTAREVAEQAEVSLRSVYVHFDDVEALFLAAAVRHLERMQEFRSELVLSGTLAERLDAFVSRRARGYEADINVRKAALLQEPFSPAIRDVLAMGRAVITSQVEEVFAPELAEASPHNLEFQRSAILLASSASTWDHLRERQELTVEAAQARVRQLILVAIGANVAAS